MDAETKEILKELTEGQAKMGISINRMEQAFFGDKLLGQKGMIEVVQEHAIEIKSFQDIKTKGKWMWKIFIGTIGIFGYLLGKVAEHAYLLFINHLSNKN